MFNENSKWHIDAQKVVSIKSYNQYYHKVTTVEDDKLTAIVSGTYANPHDPNYFANNTPATDVRMYFNGVLCCLTVAETGKYFGRPDETTNYALWDTHSVLSSSGDGMKEVVRITTPEPGLLEVLRHYPKKTSYE